MEENNLFEEAKMLIRAGALQKLEHLLNEHPYLVRQRDIPDHRNIQNTLLHEVTGMGDVEWSEEAPKIACMLIQKGAAVNAREQHYEGETPLHHAVSINNVPVTEVLLKNGANPELNGRYGGKIDTALGYALFYGTDIRLKRFFRDAPQLLQDYGAVIHLPHAAAMNDMDILVNAFTVDGRLKSSYANGDTQLTLQQALLFACKYGNVDAAAFLVRRGAKVNAIIPFFHQYASALHIAVEAGNQVEMVRFLLSSGANSKLKDKVYNSTPEGWAMFCGQDEVYRILRR